MRQVSPRPTALCGLNNNSLFSKTATSMDDGKNVVISKKRFEKLLEKSRQARQSGKTYKKIIVTQGKRGRKFRKNRRNQKSSQLFAKNSQGMPVVSKDTKNANAAVNSSRPFLNPRDALSHVFEYIHQMVRPDKQAEIIPAPCVTNYKAHPSKFNVPEVLVADGNGNLSGRVVPGPNFLQLSNTTALIFRDAVITVGPDGNGVAKYRNPSTSDGFWGEAPSIYSPNSGAIFPVFLPVQASGHSWQFSVTCNDSVPAEVLLFDANADLIGPVTLSRVGTSDTYDGVYAGPTGEAHFFSVDFENTFPASPYGI